MELENIQPRFGQVWTSKTDDTKVCILKDFGDEHQCEFYRGESFERLVLLNSEELKSNYDYKLEVAIENPEQDLKDQISSLKNDVFKITAMSIFIVICDFMMAMWCLVHALSNDGFWYYAWIGATAYFVKECTTTIVRAIQYRRMVKKLK